MIDVHQRTLLCYFRFVMRYCPAENKYLLYRVPHSPSPVCRRASQPSSLRQRSFIVGGSNNIPLR
jgi:hypothetical protein